MSDSITSILSQIRSYQSQMGSASLGPAADVGQSTALQGLAGSQAASGAQGASFSETLRGALSGVNEAQQKSGALAKAFEMGDPSADLARVMVASQQSQIAFRATVEVRNRLVQAYQDVMNMPL
ncbi:flagellar hook-basal body complex protein FliE [Stenotrophomonas sp. HITSZ_GD]|uniref:flagellar hook-basal body complex protein FliE n=1 Tax=Stenotrophomonas sp. HITSZ_GD TaxID=3037248 RepID=UPI00240E8F95|nr:flagellar hook-basal body complex protein FliE [Stenotrophomonas sp. HITSZ_GD]MDG2526523.1 flagellar hook-basal body complex protein FliE [Stenotrophomonas sp. HITSZ_GD]